jgi:hypothetical protein
MYRMKISLAGCFAAIAMTIAGSGAVSAQTNNQSGLVNVNVSNVTAQIPVSVAVPVSVAANVCDTNINILSSQLQNGPVTCTATSNSRALDTAVATAMTGGGGGGSNNQQGLVNVNLSNIKAQIPVSVALPIGIAANICGTNANILAHQAQTGSASCNASTTADAISRVLAMA